MGWEPITDTLGEGERYVTRVNSTQVLVLRHEGTLYAISNRCPHMGYPLKAGRIDEECAIHCPFHRSAFKLDTGDVVDWSPWPPGLGVMLGKLSKEKALDIYPVKEENGQILVQID